MPSSTICIPPTFLHNASYFVIVNLLAIWQSRKAFSHCTGSFVKVIPVITQGMLTLYHSALFVVPNPALRQIIRRQKDIPTPSHMFVIAGIEIIPVAIAKYFARHLNSATPPSGNIFNLIATGVNNRYIAIIWLASIVNIVIGCSTGFHLAQIKYTYRHRHDGCRRNP